MTRQYSLFLFLFFVVPIILKSQSTFVPGASAREISSTLKAKLEYQYALDLKAYQGEHKKELTEIYDQRKANLIDQFEAQHFLTDTNYQAYLDQLLHTIYQANPSLNADQFTLLLDRSWSPNAYCRGDGVIAINLGLVLRLENEAQLVFAICHELAHQIGNHVNNGIIKSVDYLYSKETQRKLKKIQRQEFKAHEAATELLENFMFGSTRHMRTNETEADSIGFQLFKNTGYDLEAPMRIMDILDVVDQPDTVLLGLNKLLDFPDYPFREKWIVERQTGIKRIATQKDTAALALADSLKTHPDCLERRKALNQQIARVKTPTDFLDDNTRFQLFQANLIKECVAAALDFELYDHGLYFALKAMTLFPDDPYPVFCVGQILNYSYELQKTHDLGKYIGQPSYRHGPAFRQIVHLLHNIRLTEIKELAFQFLNRYSVQFPAQEDLLFEYYISCKNSDREAKAKALETQYKELYPKGKFIDLF